MKIDHGVGSLFESVALQSLTEVRVWLRNLMIHGYSPSDTREKNNRGAFGLPVFFVGRI